MTDRPKDLVPATAEFFLYATPDGAVKVQVPSRSCRSASEGPHPRG